MCVIREQGLLQFYQRVDRHETHGLPGNGNQELRLLRGRFNLCWQWLYAARVPGAAPEYAIPQGAVGQ